MVGCLGIWPLALLFLIFRLKRLLSWTDARIENSEERFCSGSILPMSFSAAIVPVALVIGFEVVVRFRSIDAVVTRITKMRHIRFEFGRDRIAATHVLGSHAAGVTTRDERKSSHRADRRIGVAVSIANSVSRELVDVRSVRLLVSVTSNPMMAVVFTC